jgi:hypothetical protein
MDSITFSANAVTEIDLFSWEKIKKKYDPDHLSADESEVSRLLLEFRNECISKFETIGEASIRASINQNSISSKPELLLAHEWLESKSVARESRHDAREDEAIAIAKEAKAAAIEQARWAKWAVIIAIVAAIIAVVALNK